MNSAPKLVIDWVEIYPYALPLGVGLIVTLGLVMLLSRRSTTTKKIDLTMNFDPRDAGEDADSYANRRSSVRREGSPVKVVLLSLAFENGSETGYIVDRSTGGVRIIMMNQMAAGSTMQIRAQNAPENTPWVTVIIRSCKNNGQHFEVGCEFDRTPPWNVLLLFG